MIKYICIEDYNKYDVIFNKGEVYSIEDSYVGDGYRDVRIYYRNICMGTYTKLIMRLFKTLAEHREQQINEILGCK